MMTDDEIIAVVQAHKEGKKIEARMIDRCGGWVQAYHIPRLGWDFSHFDYRVSPEPPKPREWLVYVSDDGVIMKDARNLNEHLSFPLIRVREVEPRKPREWDLYVSDDGRVYDPHVSPYRLPIVKVREVIEE